MPRVWNQNDNPPKEAIYCGRPSKFGNPFKIGIDGTRKEVIRKFENYVRDEYDLLFLVKTELRGKDLVCWCSPLPCHCDVLLRIANEPGEDITSFF